jgi:hypothetical protein
VDEAAAVLARLRRIETLDREGADPRTLLAEIEALLEEAKAWLEAEGGCARAAVALDRCRLAVEREEAGMIAM